MPLAKTRTIAVTTRLQYQDLEYTRSLRIDSNGCWVSVVIGAGVIVVPPGVVGHILNLPNAVQNIDIDTTTPAGATAGNGTAAVVTCYARWQTQSPGLYSGAFGGPGPLVGVVGPANVASSQVTSGAGAVTLVVARPTRKGVLIKNTDATNSVAVGPATVTALNGMILKAGESMVAETTALLQVIAIAGTPIVAVFDEYY